MRDKAAAPPRRPDCRIAATAAAKAPRRGAAAHLGGEDHAGPERFCQHQAVAGTQPALAQQTAGPGAAGHRKAEPQFGALGAVAADQHRAGFFQNLGAALQHVEQILLHDRRSDGGSVAIASAVSGSPPIA